MTWYKYITSYLIPSWFNSFKYNFGMWADLMTDKCDNYAILEDDDPYQECYNWFWESINLDDTASKDMLDKLKIMVDKIDSGEIKTYPYNSLDE